MTAMPKPAAKSHASGSCEEALHGLLLAVAGPDNLDALLRKIIKSLSSHKALSGGLGLILTPGKDLSPLIFSSNLTKDELRTLAGKHGARSKCFKGFLTAPIKAVAAKGCLLARPGPADRVCAVKLLELAAKTVSGRLEREARESQLARERDVADAIAHLEELYLNFPDLSIEEISRIVLDEACRLTHSAFGFAGRISRETGALHVPAFNYGTWKHPKAEGTNVIFRKFTGLWGWVLKNKKPLLTNAAASDPRAASLAYGHVAIERFAAAPAISGKELLGILALANPPADYPPAALDVITKLARTYALMLSTKRAEHQRLTENEKHKAIINSSQDMIYNISTDGTLLFVSQGVRDYGYEPQEVIGRHFSDFVHPLDRERVRTAFLNSIRLETPPPVLSYRVLKKNGSFANIEQKSSVIRHPGASPEVMGVMRNLTHPLRAEESDRKYKTLVDITDTGYHILDSHGRVTDANKEYLRLTGRRRMEDILGRSVTEWTAPHDRRRARLEVEKCLRKGFARNLVFDYTDGRGNFTPVEINATVLKTSGSFQIISLCRDISDRKLSESELKEQAALLKAQQEASPDAILVVDRAGKIRSYNKRFKRLWGIPGKILVTKSDKLALKAVTDKLADPEAFLKRVKHLYSHPGEESHDEILLKDGRVLDRYSTAVIGAGGETYGRVWYFRDITARKKNERLLRQSEETLTQIFENTADAIFLKDTSGRYLKVNKAYAEFFLVPQEKIIGRTAAEIFRPAIAERTEREDAEALRQGKTVFFTEEQKTRSGKIYISTSRTPLHDPDGKATGILGVSRDITAIKKMEMKSASAKASETMSKATGPLAHDFNNALATINGYAMIIDDEISDTNPIKKEIGQIIKAVKRAAEITSRLQSFAQNPMQTEQRNKKN